MRRPARRSAPPPHQAPQRVLPCLRPRRYQIDYFRAFIVEARRSRGWLAMASRGQRVMRWRCIAGAGERVQVSRSRARVGCVRRCVTRCVCQVCAEGGTARLRLGRSAGALRVCVTHGCEIDGVQNGGENGVGPSKNHAPHFP